MEITSITFLVFVAVSMLSYWNIPKRFQWMLLLADSLIFYFANATWYTFIYVVVSVITVHLAVTYFAETKDVPGKDKARKRVLVLTLVCNVGILAVLKYTNLFIHTFNFLDNRILHIGGISEVTWLAPLAISYYTLQMAAYLLDCYWQIAEPYSNPLRLALYCIYFPLMTSGPICRKDQIGESLFAEHRFDYDRVKFGLYRIAWGLLKKLAISNRLAVIVDQMWDAPETSTGLNVWIAAGLFVIQLYTDFSGCMDIALGVSECFGIVLPENFKAPFFSKSIQEIWRRWHITLGTWLRDYIMNPILKSHAFISLGKKTKARFGKKQGKKIPTYLAMLILWGCNGLWHGNSWKYIVGVGFWFWLVIVLSQIMNPVFTSWKNALRINVQGLGWKAFQVIRTYILFSFGNLFFRAVSLRDAFSRVYNGFHIKMNFQFLYDMKAAVDFSKMGGKMGLLYMAVSLAAVLIVDYMIYKEIDVRTRLADKKWLVRWVLYYAMVILIVFSLDISNQESLYAQF